MGRCSLQIRNSIIPKWSLQQCIFCSIWIFFIDHSQVTGVQGKGEGISLTPHYHFHPLQRNLDISQVITAESSPQDIGSSRRGLLNDDAYKGGNWGQKFGKKWQYYLWMLPNTKPHTFRVSERIKTFQTLHEGVWILASPLKIFPT